MFLFRKRFWLGVLKVAAMVYVTAMVALLIPELRYDFGPKTPREITTPEQLDEFRGRSSVFVAVSGKGRFDNAVEDPTHGVTPKYFLLDPFGERLVVRTYEKLTDDWKHVNKHIGRLRPFRRMPFSRRVRRGFYDKLEVEIPADAFFLARDDAPRPSAWVIGAAIFTTVVWLLLFYLFFIFPRRKRRPAVEASELPGELDPQ